MDAIGVLPGVGSRSAERFAYYLLRADAAKSHDIAAALQTLHTSVKY